jgi:hypothetical protein
MLLHFEIFLSSSRILVVFLSALLNVEIGLLEPFLHIWGVLVSNFIPETEAFSFTWFLSASQAKVVMVSLIRP